MWERKIKNKRNRAKKKKGRRIDERKERKTKSPKNHT